MDMSKAIQDAHSCHTVCLETIGYCLQQGRRHASPDHIRILIDRAQTCETSADLMTRQSRMRPQVSGISADTSDVCAESCQQTGSSDQTMQRCVGACRAYAASCRPHARMAA